MACYNFCATATNEFAVSLKVASEIEDREVRLAPVKFTLESAYGSVEPVSRPEDFEEITRVAEEEHMKGVLRKMQQA